MPQYAVKRLILRKSAKAIKQRYKTPQKTITTKKGKRKKQNKKEKKKSEKKKKEEKRRKLYKNLNNK